MVIPDVYIDDPSPCEPDLSVIPPHDSAYSFDYVLEDKRDALLCSRSIHYNTVPAECRPPPTLQRRPISSRSSSSISVSAKPWLNIYGNHLASKKLTIPDTPTTSSHTRAFSPLKCSLSKQRREVALEVQRNRVKESVARGDGRWLARDRFRMEERNSVPLPPVRLSQPKQSYYESTVAREAIRKETSGAVHAVSTGRSETSAIIPQRRPAPQSLPPVMRRTGRRRIQLKSSTDSGIY